MSAEDAAYRVAHAYPGGIPSLALRMGVNVNTLQHKVNPNASTHALYLRDAELMTAFSGDPQIAQALAIACGHVCIPVLASAAGGGMLAERIAATGKEFGDVMSATLAAIADGRVTSRELAEFDTQFAEFLAAAVALRANLRDLVPQAPAVRAVK